MDRFFHSLEDLESEVRDAGLKLRTGAAIEGPAWMCQDFDAAWEDSQQRERILELAEQAPEVFATSPHVAFMCGA